MRCRAVTASRYPGGSARMAPVLDGSGREDERLAVGDDDGVLELRGEVAGRHERPAVVGLVGPRGAGRQERLDGEDEPFPELRAVPWILPARHARPLPQVAAGAVAVEVLDHGEPVAPGPTLHGAADVAQRLAGTGRGESVAIGEAGGVEQLLGDERHA